MGRAKKLMKIALSVNVDIYVTTKVKVKVKFTLEQAKKTRGGEKRYSSTLSLTSALDGVGGKRHASAALPSGKTQYPIYRRVGGSRDRSGRVRKISPPPGFDTQDM
jgi:hypothetical protein